MHQHDFKVQTSWQGGRNNVGNVQGDILSENISIPASLGGVGIGTNPDEMLVSAASSCYIISLAATLNVQSSQIFQLNNNRLEQLV